MIGPDSIIHNNWFAEPDKLRTGKEVYLEMSRAEMEVQYETKHKEYGLKKSQVQRSMSKLTDSQLYDAIKDQNPSKLYQAILPMEPKSDDNKNTQEIITDIYDHTKIKNEISRSMLSSVYARDPHHFRQGHAEVQKIFQNNVSWPKNYRPTIHEVVKPPAPKTKEKIHYDHLKEKHKYELQVLPDWEIDNVITDLESVC